MRRVLRQRRSVGVIAVLVLMVVTGVGLFRLEVDTGLETFVPAGDGAASALQERDASFGADPIVVLLEGQGQLGLVLESEQLRGLLALEGRLADLDDVAVVYGPATVLNQTAGSLQDVLVQISGRRDALQNAAEEKARSDGASKKEVAEAGRKAIVDIDRRYGALLTDALPVGLPTLSNQKFVGSVLFDDSGDPRRQWSFLVPDPKSATILVRPREGMSQGATARLVDQVEQEVESAGLDTASTTVTGVPVLTSAVAEHAIDEAPWLALAALLGVGLVLWFSRWARSRLRLLPLFAAVTGAVVTVSLFGLVGRPLTLGAVAVLPVLLGIGSDFPLYLLQARRTRRVLVTVVASALAFAALLLSPLPFVREFGMALAVGLVVTSVVTLGLVRLGLGQSLSDRDSSFDDSAREVDDGSELEAGPGRRRPVVGLVLAGTVAVAGWSFLPSIDIESSPQELAAGLSALDDVERAEQELGYSGELTITLSGDDVLSPEAVEWAVETEQRIVEEHADELRPLLSVRQLFRALGTEASAEQITSASQLIGPYLVSGVVTGDRDVAAMTFGVTLDDVRDQQRLLGDLREIVGDGPRGHEVEITGVPSLAARTLELMDANRFVLNLVGIAVASLVIGVSSRRRGLATAATAVMATGWLFAGVALLGLALSPLTVAVGALVTVTSCEFATMLLEGRRRGQSWAGRTVATAAVAGTLGYGVLALSGLAILRDFGILLALGVVASYAAARLVVAVLPPEPGQQPETEAPSGDVGRRQIQEVTA